MILDRYVAGKAARAIQDLRVPVLDKFDKQSKVDDETVGGSKEDELE